METKPYTADEMPDVPRAARCHAEESYAWRSTGDAEEKEDLTAALPLIKTRPRDATEYQKLEAAERWEAAEEESLGVRQIFSVDLLLHHGLDEGPMGRGGKLHK